MKRYEKVQEGAKRYKKVQEGAKRYKKVQPMVPPVWDTHMRHFSRGIHRDCRLGDKVRFRTQPLEISENRSADCFKGGGNLKMME